MGIEDLYAAGNRLRCGVRQKFDRLDRLYDSAMEAADADGLQRAIRQMSVAVSDLERIERIAAEKRHIISGMADDARAAREEILGESDDGYSRFGYQRVCYRSAGHEAGDVDHLTELQDFCGDGDFENMSAADVL